ncbi:hypothetical protein AHAS_Ahas16G0242600 [Arachis hypogaea]
MKSSIDDITLLSSAAATNSTAPSKPVFLTKVQREQLAFQRRQEEIANQKCHQEQLFSCNRHLPDFIAISKLSANSDSRDRGRERDRDKDMDRDRKCGGCVESPRDRFFSLIPIGDFVCVAFCP